MMSLRYLTLAVGMGAALALYLPMLSQSGRIVASPALANIPFFVIGAITSLAIFLATEKASHAVRLLEVPPWMYVAGVASGLMILGSTFLIPRIGAGPFFVLLVAGQILMGAVVSQLGILGSPVDPVSLKKAAGLLMVIAGAWLVTAT